MGSSTHAELDYLDLCRGWSLGYHVEKQSGQHVCVEEIVSKSINPSYFLGVELHTELSRLDWQ